MRQLFFIFIFGVLFSFTTNAQNGKVWTLEECINYALENNISVKQAELTTEINKNAVSSAKGNLLPNLNASASQNFNSGLSFDPTSNDAVRTTLRTNGFSLTSSWVLFNGMQNINTIRQSNLDYLASKYNLEDMKNDISLNVATAYLQILFNKELLRVAESQRDVTQKQLTRMKALVDAGAQPRGSLYDVEAQLAQEEQNVVATQNSLDLSLLSLAQLLQLESTDGFDIVSPEIDVPPRTIINTTSDQIYTTAVENQPDIKSAELGIQSAEKGLAIARGRSYPTLSLTGQISTNYSSQAQQFDGTGTAGTTQIGFVDGTNQAVLTNTFSPNFETISFSDQFTDNRNDFIGFSLNIPLFSRFQIRNGKRNAKINIEQAKYTLEQNKNALRQTIQQAHADANASYKSYQASQKSITALQEAFKYTETRFEEGLVNSVDYNNAKNNLTNAESNLLRAKYDYIFKVKVLEFYFSNQLTF